MARMLCKKFTRICQISAEIPGPQKGLSPVSRALRRLLVGTTDSHRTIDLLIASHIVWDGDLLMKGERMEGPMPVKLPIACARAAGVLYLIIIVCGLFGELYVRSSLISPGDAAATAGNIVAAEGLFRVGFLVDSIMFLSDVALAVLLYVLLKPVNKALALIAMCFRLTQTAVIAINLLHYHAAVLLLKGQGYAMAFEAEQRNALSLFFLDLHSHGYDLGLILFGAHCLLLGYLITRSLYLPKALGYLAMAAGVAYLTGSYTRFMFPNFVEAVSPIYLIAIISEMSLCLWLLFKGLNPDRWKDITGA